MKNIRVFFLSENFQFLEVKFSIDLNRCVFAMIQNGNRRLGLLSLFIYSNLVCEAAYGP